MLNKFKEKRDLIIAYKRLFHTDDGRKVLHDLMKSCHVMTSTLDVDAITMAHNEGARSIVLRILRTIQTDPEQMEQLLKLGQSEGDDDEYQIV